LFLVASLAIAADRRIEGTVKAVDAEKSTVTITTKSAATAKDETLDVVKKAKVTVNDQPAVLKDVRRGQKAVATFNTELEVVTKLDATGEGRTPMVPETVVLNELPDPDGLRSGPWPSADGLTLYWYTRPGAGGGQSWIWSARRGSKDGRFEDAKRLVPGTDMTVSADGLEMILVQGGSLWVTTRASIEAAFIRPQKVAELQVQGRLSTPCLGGDELVLYATRYRPGQPTQPVKFIRADRRAKWVGPTPVKLALPAGKVAWFLAVAPDGSRAFCGLLRVDPDHPMGNPDRIELAMMRAGGAAFGQPQVIRIDGEPLLGNFPRYVGATNELLFARHTGSIQRRSSWSATSTPTRSKPPRPPLRRPGRPGPIGRRCRGDGSASPRPSAVRHSRHSSFGT
jgi:hypothetical protein